MLNEIRLNAINLGAGANTIRINGASISSSDKGLTLLDADGLTLLDADGKVLMCKG